MLEGKSQPATRQKFLVTHPLKAFDDAPNGCVLPDATALSWVVASVQEVRDRAA